MRFQIDMVAMTCVIYIYTQINFFDPPRMLTTVYICVCVCIYIYIYDMRNILGLHFILRCYIFKLIINNLVS